MLNRVVLIGRLVADPELRYTPSGVPVANFRIAVDRRFTNAAGERETDFINIVAWRQSAEFAANYLGKGRLVAIDGRLQIRQWTTQDGQRRQTAEVVADSIQGLDRPREGGARAPEGESAPASESSEEGGDDVPGPWADE
jgi:single-strand DNA-binding protein